MPLIFFPHFLHFIIEKKIHVLTIFRLHKTTHVFYNRISLVALFFNINFTIYDNDFEIYIPSF